MKLLFMNDNSLVTLKGIYNPFETGKVDKWLVQSAPELFRQLISLYENDGELINENDFYENLWFNNKEKYLETNFTRFLNVVKEMIILKRKFDIKFDRRKRVRTSYPYYQTNLEDGTFVCLGYSLSNNSKPDPTDVINIYSQKINKNANFHCIMYEPKDEIEKEILEKYLCTDVPPAMIHCLIIALKYFKENKAMYKHFKRNTGTKVRDIYAPEDDVKEALRHLLIPLERAYDLRKRKTNQFAYNHGLSIYHNAVIHKSNKFIIKTDIQKFFDMCNWDLCYKYLRFTLPKANELPEEYLNALKTMMINPDTGGLYQGSPISGVISNAIMRAPSFYLRNLLLKQKNAVMSVYADDITISRTEKFSKKDKKDIIQTIQHVFEKYNLPFVLHPEKTKMKSNNKRKITGLVLNHNDEITFPRKKYNLLRSILHRLSLGKEITMKKSTLKGHISFFKYVDETGKVTKLLEKYKDVIEKLQKNEL
jgi:hypothetical protein